MVATYTLTDSESDSHTILLSDTINYVHEASSKSIKLTAAGASLANKGIQLPNFTLQAKDSSEASVVSNILVVSPTVTLSNDLPVQSPSNPVIGYIKEDSDFTITSQTLLSSFSDQDQDNLTVTNVSIANADHGAISVDGSAWKYDPKLNFNGTAQISYVVSDGTGTSMVPLLLFRLLMTLLLYDNKKTFDPQTEDLLLIFSLVI